MKKLITTCAVILFVTSVNANGVIIEVDIDIKPVSCPNLLNVTSQGILPVAILGTEYFNVNDVDVGSVSLEGVAPIRFGYEDVATPFDGELCDCHEADPDGYLDLILKFDTQEIVAVLGDVEDGDVQELILTSEDVAGIPMVGSDCIRVIKKDKAVVPALSMEVVDIEDPVEVGARTTYVISVKNQGTVTATNIRISCLLDNDVEYISSAGATAGSYKDQTVRFYPLRSLSPTAAAAWRVVVEAIRSGDVLFKAVMKADQLSFPVEETELTHINSMLSMEVVDIEDPIIVGTRTTYVISVKNQGTVTATNIRISCLWDDNIQYISSAGATPGLHEGQTVRFYPLGSLSPTAAAAWRVVVEAIRPGNVLFKAVMNADQHSFPVEETELTHIYE